ncbi:hypothetical protein BCR35DRAFT_332475 [Leucosporidium creatinivorum]|uniref:Uncharacterized protein n=1 Tax=Leucosporidium creatinivorum TaxID=106004 RepID=A0A1Y2F456_9BASI|nr:hypothetical protein BCR35DRAFT_332475 [Leucosporidium creatinivorum]
MLADTAGAASAIESLLGSNEAVSSPTLSSLVSQATGGSSDSSSSGSSSNGTSSGSSSSDSADSGAVSLGLSSALALGSTVLLVVGVLY